MSGINLSVLVFDAPFMTKSADFMFMFKIVNVTVGSLFKQ